jgi:hypothetical protein
LPTAILAWLLVAVPATATTAPTVKTFAGSYGEGLAIDVPGAFGRMAVHGNTLYTLPETNSMQSSDPAAVFGYVKAIDLFTGQERVIAGTGDGGDLGPALDARLDPLSITAAPDGTLYVGEPSDVRKIDSSGTITTIAHIGGLGVAADSYGDVFVVDGQSAYEITPLGARTTLLTTNTGPTALAQIVVTPAGDVYALHSGYGVYHLTGPDAHPGCRVWNPRDIAVGPDGAVYGIDFNRSMLQRCDDATGHDVDVVAVPRFPTDLAMDSAGEAYVTTAPSTDVERVALDGSTAVVAGNGTAGSGTAGFMKAGGPAREQVLYFPDWPVAEPDGSVLYHAQNGYSPTSVRRITPDGIVHDVFPADGIARGYIGMMGVASDGSGGLFAAGVRTLYHQDSAGHVTRLINSSQGGYSGDGGPSTAASVRTILGIARDGAGDLFFADSGNNALRYIEPDGTIHTLTAALHVPIGAVVAPSGRILAEDDNGASVTGIDGTGHAQTVAGGGSTVCPTTSIPGTELSIHGTGRMTIDSAGDLFVSDWSCIVKITPDGNATTVAGFADTLYTPCHSHGDGAAPLATCIRPAGLTVDAAGDLLFIDGSPERIRVIAGAATAGFPQPGNPWTGSGDTSADATAPTVSVHPLPVITRAANRTVMWTATDNASGVATADVRYRRARYNGGVGAWTSPSAWRATPATSVTASLQPGYTYCFEVRARDHAGNLSTWSAPGCVARALDDRAATAPTNWARHASNAFYLGTYSQTRADGAKLTLPRVRADRVGIISRTCGTCGKISISLGGTRIAVVSLHSASTHRHRLILFSPFPMRTGTLTIRVISSGRLVRIDGIAVSRT